MRKGFHMLSVLIKGGKNRRKLSYLVSHKIKYFWIEVTLKTLVNKDGQKTQRDNNKSRERKKDDTLGLQTTNSIDLG